MADETPAPDQAAALSSADAIRIATEAAAAARAAHLEELKAVLGDLAGARAQTVALVQAGSSIAWATPIVSALVLTAFGTMLTLVLTASVPEGNRDLANIMLGTLNGMATTVVAYWVGSSRGSAVKDEVARAKAT